MLKRSDDPFVHKHTGGPIAIVVTIGLLLVAAAFTLYASRCWGSPSGECEALRKSPPDTSYSGRRGAGGRSHVVLANGPQEARHSRREPGSSLPAICDGGRADRQRWLTTIGAIYALEQIAKDSPGDHWTVVETLAAFVRNAKTKEGSSTNRQAQVQAAITVLGCRRAAHDVEGGIIDLRGAPLWGINFDGLNFAGADFGYAYANDATFFGTNLSGARLEKILGLWTEEDDYIETYSSASPDLGGPGQFNDQTRGKPNGAFLRTRLLKNVDDDDRDVAVDDASTAPASEAGEKT